MAENIESTLDAEEGIIELEDEEGNITRFEFVDRLEHNGVAYYALVPADIDEESEEAEFVVLKETEVNGEDMLVTIDSDEEYTTIGEMFIQRFAALADLDFDGDEDYDDGEE